MKTDKPLSTITYLSVPTINNKLKTLRLQGIIGDYAFIVHYGEGNEKNHIHVYFEPLTKVDTDKLREEWQEPVMGTYILNEDLEMKDVGTMRFQKSDFNNWLLYSLHDMDYLLMKRERKEFSYELSDVVSTYDNLKTLYDKAKDEILYTDEMKILDYLEKGGDPKQLLLLGYDIRSICQVLDFIRKSTPYFLQHKDYVRLKNINECMKDIKLPIDIL